MAPLATYMSTDLRFWCLAVCSHLSIRRTDRLQFLLYFGQPNKITRKGTVLEIDDGKYTWQLNIHSNFNNVCTGTNI
jgi:hypothetical protein